MLLDPEPQIEIIGVTYNDPIALTAGAAATCYYPKTASGTFPPIPEELDTIRKKYYTGTPIYTLKSNHLSTWQHWVLTLGVSNVSRQWVHDVAHTHQYYNTSQGSQRYREQADKSGGGEVEYRARRFPFESSENRRTVDTLFVKQFETGRKISSMLLDFLIDIGRDRPEDLTYKDEEQIGKKAMEIGRYTYPKAALAGMYYTTNITTILRLYYSAETSSVPWEASLVASKAMDAIEEKVPGFRAYVESALVDENGGKPLKAGTTAYTKARPKIDFGKIRKSNEHFDGTLGGRRSKLVTYTPNAEQFIADEVRRIIMNQDLSDTDAIDLVMNPGKNLILNHPLDLELHDPLTKVLELVNYGFMRRVSHTCDSQLQRHREDYGPRPPVEHQITDTPDNLYPELIARHPEAKQIYDDLGKEVCEIAVSLVEDGENPEFVSGIFMNGQALRYINNTQLRGFRHRQEQRTCLRAQEEANRVALEELTQVAEVNPDIARYLGPPCIARSLADIKPQCNQGKLYCGVPVWTKGESWHIDLEYYPRTRKMSRTGGFEKRDRRIQGQEEGTDPVTTK